MDVLFNEEIYERCLLPAVRRARHSLWIATANLKDVQLVEEEVVTSLWERLVQLAGRGVDVRILHSGAVSQRLTDSVELAEKAEGSVKVKCCQRNHMKCLITDGFELFFGSANLTGAGMGAKSAGRRNFEAGVFTRDLVFVRRVQKVYEKMWQGAYCSECVYSCELQQGEQGV